jgi:hypothetical protein
MEPKPALSEALAKDTERWIIAKSGNVEIPAYRLSDGRICICYYEGGQRERRLFRNEGKAKREAALVAAKIHAGQQGPFSSPMRAGIRISWPCGTSMRSAHLSISLRRNTRWPAPNCLPPFRSWRRSNFTTAAMLPSLSGKRGRCRRRVARSQGTGWKV